MKLYLLSTKGLGSYYVLANDPSSAEKTLDAVLDGNDYGFFMERDVTEIKVIADSYVEKDGRISLDNRRNGVIIVGMDVAEIIANAMRPPLPSASVAAKEDVCDIDMGHTKGIAEWEMSDLEASKALASMDVYSDRKIYLHGEILRAVADVSMIVNKNGLIKAEIEPDKISDIKGTYLGKEVIIPDSPEKIHIITSLYWLSSIAGVKYEELVRMQKEGRIGD